MKPNYLLVILSFVLSACHTENFSVHATLEINEPIADKWCYMFASYGNQLDILDSCKIENNKFLLTGNLPQKEVLIEVLIPHIGSYFFLGAKNERISLNIDDGTRSFFPMSEGSYATTRMAKIAKRYREIGYAKLDSLKHLYAELPANHAERKHLNQTIQSHERELTDLVRDAIQDEHSILLAITAKMWFIDPNPKISTDSIAQIIAGICQRFPNDPNIGSINPEHPALPPTRKSMETSNLKAMLMGQSLPYPELKIPEQPNPVDPNVHPLYKIGDRIQPISLMELSGTFQNTANCKTEYMLVDFWASWCKPCIKEIPYLLSAQQRFSDILTIYAISLDDDVETWIQAIEKNAMYSVVNFHLSRNNQSFAELVSRFNIQTIPHNFLLDKNRRIIAIDLRGEALEKKLNELICAN